MTKIKITTLTDKSSDDEILTRLKSIGVKVKDIDKEELRGEERKQMTTLAGDSIVEKRIASTIIRRRVQPAPPPPPPPEPEQVVEEKARKAEKRTEPKREEKIEEPRKGGPRVVHKELPPEPSKVAAEEEKEPPPSVHVRRQERVEKEKVKVREKEKLPDKEKPGEKEEKPEEAREEFLKGESEIIGEAKEKEITKVLEEAYKQDLDKEVALTEDEGEKKKKKTEKLLKKIEEQEAEERGVKKKGVLKRKVVIKEEDLYTFRKQRGRPIPAGKGKRDRRDERHLAEEKKPELKIVKKIIKMGSEIQVSELAKRMGIKAQDIIKRLLPMGVVTTINQNIDFDTAFLVAGEFHFEMEKVMSIEEEFQAMEDEHKDKPEDLKPRSPVVTIMGHVDHGKTLLLDTIRQSNVAEREAGGITQHIGAHKVNVDGKEIIFIDTPGHEAFTAMRARGARVTDVVILVVAADDGVMPQTVEAINHAKAAKVPIIVAVNKIDKQNANPDKVMKDLADHGLIPEDWGGTTLFAKVSAKRKTGIKELLDLILLQAEMLELKADPNTLAKGVIIESELSKGHGPVGTLIIQEGTLKIQDPFIAGTMFGRVRAMVDDKGNRILSAPPSTPVLVVGFQEVPQAGDRFIVTTEERYARELSKFRLEKLREKDHAGVSRTTLEELYSKMGGSEKTVLNLIIKGDVGGTIDAIGEALKKLSNDLVEVQVVHSGVGAITETDVNLAVTTGAILIGFNTKPVAKAQALGEHEKVQIRTYSVIYDIIDDVKSAMEGLLQPKIVETPLGKVEVRKVFAVSKIGTIAGSYVLEGKVMRNAMARVTRNGTTVFTGKIGSLKRFKDDAKEVMAGYECGVGMEGFNDVQEGDILEVFVQEKERQTLDG
jgi:translation initiation factor IF-2